MNKWLDKWTKNEHKQYKVNTFEILNSYLNFAPKNILDIGCGLAYESELFQKTYNSNLYLLDGDFAETENNTRDTDYNTVDSFKFYNTISTLKESFNARKLQYTFIDANNIILDKDKKFDLVYSILSCGFHYPITAYVNLIKEHTTKNSKIILDIRNSSFAEQSKYFEVVKIVKQYKKYKTLEIKLK